MANQYRHKRYFKLKIWHIGDSAYNTDYVFQNVDDANSKIGFVSAFDTSSPTKTEAFEDDNKTFVVTYEFNSQEEQDAFMTALTGSDRRYTGNFTNFTKAQLGLSGDQTAIRNIKVEHVKTEWLYEDGSISATTNF